MSAPLKWFAGLVDQATMRVDPGKPDDAARTVVHPLDGPVVDDRIVTSPARVRAVADVGLLDTGDEEPFDRWAQRATELTGASVGLVSLVDATRSFFKSFRLSDGSAGAEREVPISMSLCREVVARGAPLIVNDAINDPRTKGYGAVRAFPVGAYAGMPLHSAEGHVLGSFCVVDPVAREWTEDEITALADLAAAVQSELRLRSALNENRRHQALTEVHQRIHALMLDGAPRATVLAELVAGVEQQTDGLHARIVLPEAGPCGVLASATCWDVPIVGTDGVSHGRFALCSDQPWTALPQDVALLEQAARLAVIVLERDAATRMLQAVERHTRLILDHAPDAFVSMDSDGRIIEWNVQAEAMFGWSRPEALGCTVAELIIPPQTREDHKRGLARYLKSGEAHVLNRPTEVQAVCRDGRLIPVELTIAAVRRGEDATFNAFVRDVSDRHARELALREAEAMFRGAFTYASVPMCLATLKTGRWSQVNPALCALLGYSEDQLLGRPFAEVTHRDDIDDSLDGARRLRDGEIAAFETEKRYLHADGHVIWVSLSVSLLRGAQQEPRCFIAQVVDITARKASEEALLASERHLADAQTLGGLGSWDWDPEADLVTWSDQLCQITGFAQGEYPRTVDGFSALVHEQDQAGFEEILEQTRETGFSDSNYRLVRPDGDVRWVHGRRRAHYDADGRPLRMSGTLQDITDRREVERAKEEFVSVVSHELRTPLTSIRGALGLLAGGVLSGSPEKTERMLQIALENTDRLMRLINDILDIERITSGMIDMRPHACESTDLIDRAIQGLGPVAAAARVTLAAAAEHVTVSADPDRIVQTLTNLLGNAIKFSPPETTVVVSATHRDSVVLFEVRDEGRGIPAGKLGSIFERFQQVDSSDAREKGGTGLGLAICRSIVQQHGGKIWAESIAGHGSTFKFTLPAEPATAPAIGERRPLILICADDVDAPEVLETPPETVRVLVAEDDLDLATVLIALFERHGLQAMHAATGAAAVHLSSELNPDLVILDVGLPDGDGFWVADWLRQHERLGSVPIVVYTARDLDSSERQRLDTGHTSFMTKGDVTLEQLEHDALELMGLLPCETPAVATDGR